MSNRGAVSKYCKPYQSLLLPISLLEGNCLPMVGVNILENVMPSNAAVHGLFTLHVACTRRIVSSCSAWASTKCSTGACLGWTWSSANIFVRTGFGQFAKFKYLMHYLENYTMHKHQACNNMQLSYCDKIWVKGIMLMLKSLQKQHQWRHRQKHLKIDTLI